MDNHAMRTIRCILLSLLGTTLLYGGTAHAQTQTQSSASSCDDLKHADSEMNSTYQAVLKQYDKDSHLIEKLKSAQRAWMKFRDAHIDSIYPAGDKRVMYGSAYPMCNCMEAAELTRQRVEQLKRWLAPDNEGDVCAGNRR